MIFLLINMYQISEIFYLFNKDIFYFSFRRFSLVLNWYIVIVCDFQIIQVFMSPRQWTLSV